MQKKKYYVSVSSGVILEDQTAATYEAEITPLLQVITTVMTKFQLKPLLENYFHLKFITKGLKKRGAL